MALKQLVLRKRIEGLKSQLEALRTNDAGFETRSAEMKKREAEIEAAVNEVTEETAPEDKATVDAEVEKFDADQQALENEKAANEESKKKIEEEISALEIELTDIEGRSVVSAKTPEKPEERKGDFIMNKRFNFGMTAEARSAYLSRDDVKEFYTRVRGMIGQKRAVTGAELNIPTVTLALLRDNLDRYSKLISRVNRQSIPGKSRQSIMGTIPEGVWTEAVGKLNELTISFAQIEVDGFKVGGFIPVPNSTLEDSDVSLSGVVEDALAQAIGLAVDKAILYGTGAKMPLGIATRLAQTIEPTDWGTNAPAWTDLHTSHIIKLDPTAKTAEEFFSELILDLGTVNGHYATGGTFWAMSRKTKALLMSKSINFNAAGALVAGSTGMIPLEGGTIDELDFIPYGDIIGGYGSLYALAERAGASIAVSEHAMFIEDQTVFKGTARYDGRPVFGEGFIAININNAAPTTTITFPGDTANA
jgi:HK97 family phage major capsid protein